MKTACLGGAAFGALILAGTVAHSEPIFHDPAEIKPAMAFYAPTFFNPKQSQYRPELAKPQTPPAPANEVVLIDTPGREGGADPTPLIALPALAISEPSLMLSLSMAVVGLGFLTRRGMAVCWVRR